MKIDEILCERAQLCTPYHRPAWNWYERETKISENKCWLRCYVCGQLFYAGVDDQRIRAAAVATHRDSHVAEFTEEETVACVLDALQKIGDEA